MALLGDGGWLGPATGGLKLERRVAALTCQG